MADKGKAVSTRTSPPREDTTKQSDRICMVVAATDRISGRTVWPKVDILSTVGELKATVNEYMGFPKTKEMTMWKDSQKLEDDGQTMMGCKIDKGTVFKFKYMDGEGSTSNANNKNDDEDGEDEDDDEEYVFDEDDWNLGDGEGDGNGKSAAPPSALSFVLIDEGWIQS